MHSHSPAMGGHSHAPSNLGSAFAIGVILNGAFVLTEVAYGLAAHSVALMADAGHNLGDVFGLLIAWCASAAMKVGPSSTRTYGLRKSSVLAALINAVLLLATTGAIAYEALRRLGEPGPVHGSMVIWVAGVGVLVNGGTALLFMSGRDRDLNVRGAFTHMAADAAIVLGVGVSGAIILYTGWTALDPIVSLAICGAIVWGTWSLLFEATNMALDAVPSGISLDEVKGYLTGLPGVKEVHDLHIWSMSTTEVALTAHLVLPAGPADDCFLRDVAAGLHGRFGIEHTTIQIETGDPEHPCGQSSDEVI